jgi:perilipin-2
MSFSQNANRVFNWSLKKAEFTVSKAAKSTAPVVLKLQTPILKVDSLLCAGLDFVEAKVPAVKLPPHQVYISLYGAPIL